MLNKTCPTCGATHPKEDFPRESRHYHPCRRERMRLASIEWRNRHPERAKATYRNSQARRRAADLEGMRTKAREYAANNKPKIRAMDTRRRARERGAVTKWDTELDIFVGQEAASLCKLRERQLGGKWHVDHTVPLAAKTACGLHNAFNLAVVPAKYNCSKRNSFSQDKLNTWEWLTC